jgi:ferredoxin
VENVPIDEGLSRELRDYARQVLEGGQVSCVIGYEASPGGGVRPSIVYEPKDVERLIWSDACVHNLVTFLHDKKKPQKRGEAPPSVAIVVKPCDSRALNVLLAEGQVERERITVIGVACEGLRSETGEPAARCTRCGDRVPVIYDVLIGELPEVEPGEDTFGDLEKFEGMHFSERLDFWLAEFDRCIRCYACRQVCPGCYCTTCMFERDDGLWVDIGIELPQKHIFHLGRALHLAGRCVECDECERVCPMGLPLSLLNRRLVKEIDKLFDHRAGREEAPTPLLFELGEEGSPI